MAVVEDDAPARNALGRLLQAVGFEPALFESAEAYIDASPAPLCVVVDVQLPGMSGIELQDRLRAAGTAPPIIVTTANREPTVRERARAERVRQVLPEAGRWQRADYHHRLAGQGLGLSRRPRVLVADDHPALMTAVCRLLELDSEVVGSVTDGELLLEAAQRLQPDVIVLDVNLPHLNGLDACRQITQREPGDTNHRVHGDDRSGRHGTIVRGRSICVRVQAGGRRRACSRPSNGCVTTAISRRASLPLSAPPRPPGVR